jgi:hypothetical protein
MLSSRLKHQTKKQTSVDLAQKLKTEIVFMNLPHPSCGKVGRVEMEGIVKKSLQQKRKAHRWLGIHV